MTSGQIHLIAFMTVMLIQIAHGRLAARGTDVGPNDFPPRAHYPWLVHMLFAAAIAFMIGYIAQAFGWAHD